MLNLQQQVIESQRLLLPGDGAAAAGMVSGLGMSGMTMAGMSGAAAAPSNNKRRGSSSKAGGRQSQANASTALTPLGGAPGGFAMVPQPEVQAPAAPAARGDMSFDQRAAVAKGVSTLSANNIARVVDIIRQSMPGLGNDNQEIEIDVNALDDATLWRLKDYIDNCQKSRRPAKAKAARGAKNWKADVARATQQTEQSLASVRAARGAINGDDAEGEDDPFANQFDAGGGGAYEDEEDPFELYGGL